MRVGTPEGHISGCPEVSDADPPLPANKKSSSACGLYLDSVHDIQKLTLLDQRTIFNAQAQYYQAARHLRAQFSHLET